MAVPQPVKILHWSKFEDWSVKVTSLSRGNLDTAVERKSWQSGRDLVKPIVEAVLKNTGITQAGRVQFRHLTTWDPEVGIAIMELNSNHNIDLPTFKYTGTVARDQATTICKNVRVAMLDELNLKADEGKYNLPGFRNQDQEPAPEATPTLNEDIIKLCCARANKELPIKEVELMKAKALFGVLPDLADQLEQVILHHNGQCNPSGVPWKEKRPAPTGGQLGSELMPAEKAV